MRKIIYFFSLCVALEHEGTEGGGALLVPPAPVSALHHKAHEPAVLLVGRKLGHVPQLKLKHRGRGGSQTHSVEWTHSLSSGTMNK